MLFIFYHPMTNNTEYKKHRYLLHEWKLEWMSKSSYSLLLILWGFPTIFRAKFYLILVKTAYHNQSCWALQWVFHTWGIGKVRCAPTELSGQTIPELPGLAPVSLTWDPLLQAALRFSSSSCRVDEVLVSRKCSQTEGSLLPPCFLGHPLLSLAQSFHPAM